MSDTTPAPYSDGKSRNFEQDPNAANALDGTGTTPDFAPTAAPAGDQVPTDNGGTTPDTTPTSPADAGGVADTTEGSVEGGDTVAGSGPGVAEADPEAPVAPEPDVLEAGEEPEVVADPGPQGEVAEADVVEEPVPAVMDEELHAGVTASDGDEHNLWTIWSKKRKAWFNVIEEEGIFGEANGYRLKSSARDEGRDEAKARGVVHFIQKKDGEVQDVNSYGYRPKHELD